MKIRNSVLAAAFLAGVIATGALAQTIGGHSLLTPNEIKWGPGPASIPPGAQAVVLLGDPDKEGLFVLRLKLPSGYRVPPHTHPKPEITTVISGSLRLGMGETADRSKAKLLPAGSFIALPTGMAHYAFADEETVLQVSTNGPWGLTYVNPKDDPRQKTQ
ncbi:MAG: DUF4437 domain-containing protein [Rhodospirillales bacterium]|nr:DUF4437 domain-containing protein [Rhodospirillales bacterium]